MVDEVKSEMGAKGAVASPYLNARREWDERYGSALAQARSWRLIAGGCLAVAACAVAGVAWVGGQSKIQPFVVGINDLGAPVAVARPASVAAESVNERIRVAQIASYITDLRTVTVDREAKSAMLARAYAMSTDEVSAFLNDTFSKEPPFSTNGEVKRIQINTVLPISAGTYEVSWTEDVSAPGRATSSEQWKATVTVGMDSRVLASPEVALHNPLGFFVRSLAWQRVIGN